MRVVSKPRMGRPPLPRRDLKQATLVLRMTLAERADIDLAAEAEGANPSEWARRVLLDAALKLLR